MTYSRTCEQSVSAEPDHMKKLPPKGRFGKIRGEGENLEKEAAKMYYTGIDLHKRTCFLTPVDENGKTVHKAHLENTEGSLLSYFEALPGDTKIVIESMASWYGL